MDGRRPKHGECGQLSGLQQAVDGVRWANRQGLIQESSGVASGSGVFHHKVGDTNLYKCVSDVSMTDAADDSIEGAVPAASTQTGLRVPARPSPRRSGRPPTTSPPAAPPGAARSPPSSMHERAALQLQPNVLPGVLEIQCDFSENGKVEAVRGIQSSYWEDLACYEPWGEEDLHANGCSVRAVLSADEWEETRRAQHGNVGVTYQISLATHNRLLEALD